MRYLLDTNTLIAILNDRRSKPSKKLRRHEPTDVVTSSIVIHELYFGAFKSGRPIDNVARLDELQIPTLALDREDARSAGEIRAALKKAGTPIGPYDILIAGQAFARNLILVTNNTREFARVGGLQVEDWHR
jgi:tRNA(fMet)-specific endonuclease VapC